MKESEVSIFGVSIKFLRKPAKRDAQHLVVIFSGFGGDGGSVWNFSNSFSECPAEVLWIKDDFFDGQAYYLCAKGLLNIEEGVINFIKNVLAELNLTLNDCTFLGGSKGGSAALFYGLKYEVKNIISSVPQFNIGSYVEKDWPETFNHMFLGLSEDERKRTQYELDCYIKDAAVKSKKNKNIYLITSDSDEQYDSEISSNIEKLSRFDNFNLVYANSFLITRHNQVNRHVVAFIVSLVNLIVFGIPPILTKKEMAFRSRDSEGGFYLNAFTELMGLTVKNGRIFPYGYAFIYGIPCSSYDDIKFTMILVSENVSHSIELAKGNKPNEINEFFPDLKGDYSKCWFCSPRYEGYEIPSFPDGVWNVFININAKGVERKIPMKTKILDDFTIAIDNKEFSFSKADGCVVFDIH